MIFFSSGFHTRPTRAPLKSAQITSSIFLYLSVSVCMYRIECRAVGGRFFTIGVLLLFVVYMATNFLAWHPLLSLCFYSEPCRRSTFHMRQSGGFSFFFEFFTKYRFSLHLKVNWTDGNFCFHTFSPLDTIRNIRGVKSFVQLLQIYAIIYVLILIENEKSSRIKYSSKRKFLSPTWTVHA